MKNIESERETTKPDSNIEGILRETAKPDSNIESILREITKPGIENELLRETTSTKLNLRGVGGGQENMRNRKNIQAAKDRLLRQVDRELAQLTPSTRSCTAGQERLENTEPLTYREALNSPQQKEWIKGIHEELRSLHVNRTWDTVKGAEPQKNHAIDLKWVFKIKTIQVATSTHEPGISLLQRGYSGTSKKTKDLKLVYSREPEDNLRFVDADWANSGNRKSVGGYAFLLGGAAISWAPKKQSFVALSTEEAEYTAFTEASSETLWFRQILLDIENRGNQPETGTSNLNSEPLAPGPTTIYADNQAAIKHAKSEGMTARTKHFDMRLQHSRDLQHKGALNFAYTKSSENTADIFTKGPPAPAHQRHVERLGLQQATSKMVMPAHR